MKSFDYLNLVRTASRPRTAEQLSDADSRMHAVVWWGALANFLVSVAIGIALSVLGHGANEAVLFWSAVGTVPALIYFSFWLWTMSDFPRLSRVLIGLPSFIVSALIVYYSFVLRYEFWFTLIPICLYFLAIVYVALKQAHELRGGVEGE